MESLIRPAACLIFGILTLGWASPARAQVSLVGDWASRVHEDPNRNDPLLGDFTGLPLTRQAVAHGDAWQEGRLTVLERQCVPNGAAWAFRGPAQIRIWEEKDPTTQEVVAIKTFIATFAQTRTIWMDGRPHPGKYAEHTWQGFSTGKWEGGKLTVTTTHLKRFFHRRNGLPQSDQTTLTEEFIRHGNNYLTHITIAQDPVYLSEPLVQSQNFVLVSNVTPATYQTWTVCRPQVEIAGRAPGFVPHYLPGANPFVEEYSKRFGLPLDATRAGAETMYPEYRPTLKALQAATPARAPAAQTQARAPTQAGAPQRAPAASAADGDVEIVQVASDVFMLASPSGNVMVNVGPQGLLVVDAGSEAMSAKTAAAIRRISDRPIRFIVQTSSHPDHVGGTAALNKLAQAIRSREVIDEGAVIIAHENTFNRMSAPTGDKPPMPVAAWANSTFFVAQQDEHFNGQAVQLFHKAAATDGDVAVVLRRSDVIAAGDIFDKTRYPAIDIEKGGSIQGEIDAVNWLLDVMVTGEKEEGGTMVVPGRGRLCDEGDVSEYRDMLTIIRDRVQDLIKKGMTLEQVKAARPSFEYDGEYGPGDALCRNRLSKPEGAALMTRCLSAIAGLVAIIVAATVTPGAAQGGRGGGAAQRPRRRRVNRAPVDLTGYWVSVVSEDWRFRIATPRKGDIGGVPLNPEGRKVAEGWDPARDAATGNECRWYGAAGGMRVPGRLHITWQDEETLKIELDAGQQVRLLHFGRGVPTCDGTVVAGKLRGGLGRRRRARRSAAMGLAACRHQSSAPGVSAKEWRAVQR